jgi:hypothetical protein
MILDDSLWSGSLHLVLQENVDIEEELRGTVGGAGNAPADGLEEDEGNEDGASACA